MGWATHTWTAHCHDRTYYCSAAKTGQDSAQINCREAAAPKATEDTARASSESAKTSDGAPAKKAAVDASAPTTVAGFSLGSGPAEAEAACTGAGQTWQAAGPDHFSCSAPAKSIGLDSTVLARFCDTKLCAVKLRVLSGLHSLSAFSKLSSMLRGKYGEPSDRNGSLPGVCLHNDNEEDCLKTGRPKLSQSWKWPDGTRIDLRVNAQGDAPELELVYVQRPNRVDADAL